MSFMDSLTLPSIREVMSLCQMGLCDSSLVRIDPEDRQRYPFHFEAIFKHRRHIETSPLCFVQYLRTFDEPESEALPYDPPVNLEEIPWLNGVAQCVGEDLGRQLEGTSYHCCRILAIRRARSTREKDQTFTYYFHPSNRPKRKRKSHGY